MNLQEIKKAVDAGKIVHWATGAYKVIKDKNGEYLIHCTNNDHYVGLTWKDGKTLNGKESEFYTHYGPKLSIVASATCERCQSTVTEIDLDTGHCEPCLLSLFASWVNDFLTVERFAEFYGFDVDTARKVITHGRELWNQRATANN